MTTKIDVLDLRIQRVLPYLGNPAGQSLDDLLLTIDDRLKDASPDAIAPGLINWTHKDLFVDKWVVESGSPVLIYNQFGASKIGKGRYEITGTGRLSFNRLLAVSEVRGVTARIFIGSTQPGAQATVGVQCYDADQNYIGDNGGFVLDNGTLPVGVFDYFKASAFGEAVSGARFLKPNTRFVKFYVEVGVNPNTVFFDESEMTVFEMDERYLQIFSPDFDWNRAEFPYFEATANTVFTFKNDIDGRVRTITVKNTGLSDIDLTFPTAKWQGGVPLTLVRPGRTSMFTFIKAGGELYGSVIEELELLDE